MTQAFDVKELVVKMEAKGLPVLEAASEQVWEAVKEWLIESGTLKGGLAQGIISVAVPAVDAFVKEQLNKIDGQVG